MFGQCLAVLQSQSDVGLVSTEAGVGDGIDLVSYTGDFLAQDDLVFVLCWSGFAFDQPGGTTVVDAEFGLQTVLWCLFACELENQGVDFDVD